MTMPQSPEQQEMQKKTARVVLTFFVLVVAVFLIFFVFLGTVFEGRAESVPKIFVLVLLFLFLFNLKKKGKGMSYLFEQIDQQMQDHQGHAAEPRTSEPLEKEENKNRPTKMGDII